MTVAVPLYPPVSHAPLNRRAIRCFRNAIQFHHVGSHSNPEMRRDILGGRDDADMFGGATE